MENKHFKSGYSKLTEANKERLEDFSSNIGSGYQIRDKEIIEKFGNQMSGYLMCLVDAGIITRLELANLYLYYFRLNQ